jgi:hypothetical protein
MKDFFKKIHEDIQPPEALKKQVLEKLNALRLLEKVVDDSSIERMQAELDFLLNLDEYNADEEEHDSRIQ